VHVEEHPLPSQPFAERRAMNHFERRGIEPGQPELNPKRMEAGSLDPA
jgi:hypothetical protein